MLNDNERKKYEAIEKVINGKISRKEASDELKLSLKQIDRLKKYFSLKESKDLFMAIVVKKMLIRKMII